jgi:dTDP-4-amino-4,6-dideoxygalactose transaminase
VCENSNSASQNIWEQKNCIAICNATVALEIVIRALQLKGEVIVPSFTFVATAHALQWQGVKPVFCDVDRKTHNLDPKRVSQAITPRTSGIIGVHLWGRPCDVAALSEIAQTSGLKLIFDAAHAFGCAHKGTLIGSFGDAEIFSFHATKFFNTFEGGAVTTNNDDLARRIRLMMNFGFAGYDDVVELGTNGKLSEVSAAMGLQNLQSLDEFINVNRTNYEQYRRELSRIPGLSLLGFDEAERNNYQYVVIEVDEATTKVSRDQVVDILWAENVLARRYFYPGCHRMEPYRSYYPNSGSVLPETEKLVQSVLVMPTGTAVSPDDISKVCGILEMVVRNGSYLRDRLDQQLQASGASE